jgi:hypothetical protein
LPPPGARYEVTDGALTIDGQPADWLSYVIFAVHRTAARGRDLSAGAAWEQRLREAEDEARNTLQDPLADRDRRQEVWKKCFTLIKEAQVLLRSDPNYLRSEAEAIVRATLLECEPLVAVTPVVGRQMGRGTLPSDFASERSADVSAQLESLGVKPGEDLAQSTADYAERLETSREVLDVIARSGAA